MEAETIMVIVLIAGGIALLIWFEINSRRNEVKKKQMEGSAQLKIDPSGKKSLGKVEPEKSRKSSA